MSTMNCVELGLASLACTNVSIVMIPLMIKVSSLKHITFKHFINSFSFVDFIKDHLSELHPQEFAFICERVKTKETNNVDNLKKCIKIVDLVDKEEMKEIKITTWKNEVNDLTKYEDSTTNESKTGIKIMKAYSLGESE